MRKEILSGLLGLLLTLNLGSVHALTINLNDIGGVKNTPAEAGIQKAATFWESLFTDNVTVNLNVGFDSLPSNVLGQASNSFITINYSAVRSALIADAKTRSDLTATQNLAAGPAFDTFINRTSDNPNGAFSASPYLDNDDGTNNANVYMTLANARAIGLYQNPFVIDGTINFNTDHVWDFDNGDGINSGAFDFVGIAIHEIGHSLGFISGVDRLDSGRLGSATDNDYLSSTLDLFRYSDLSAISGVTDMSADNRGKFFSIDGGATNLAFFSTGKNFGDRYQASHWLDNLGLGIMDPTFFRNELGLVTPEDLLAFDVIGWDVLPAVPELSAFALLMIGLTVIAFKHRLEIKRASRNFRSSAEDKIRLSPSYPSIHSAHS
ncbi:MAG: M10 family metallopeptidase domain-containing protein [Nitrosomonas sp.]|nr:M10 family metallopeptidase domain-containing protein [Nitrosomonas sp.]